MDLRDRVAIVTGASRGIGRQLCIGLGRAGANVVVAARTVDPHHKLPGTIADTVAAVEAGGGRGLAVRCDVTVPADLQRLVDTTVDTFGRVDLLVNNAADTQGSAAAVDASPRDSWLRQFDANVHAPFFLIGLVIPHMREQGEGVIINITSSQGDLQAVDSHAADGPIKLGTLLGYATTKAALNRLANALAPDLLADRVAIVNVDPGFTRTEFVELLDQHGLVDAAAAPMDLTVETVLRIATDPSPLRYTGEIVRVRDSYGQ